MATLAHRQEVAEAADIVVKRLDLLDHHVGRAGEADAGVDELLDTRPIWVDLPATAQLNAARNGMAPSSTANTSGHLPLTRSLPKFGGILECDLQFSVLEPTVELGLAGDGWMFLEVA